MDGCHFIVRASMVLQKQSSILCLLPILRVPNAKTMKAAYHFTMQVSNVLHRESLMVFYQVSPRAPCPKMTKVDFQFTTLVPKEPRKALSMPLLKASPKGAQSKDDQGRLPLHHACRKTASERVIRTLLRVYPRASQIKDDQEKLPIHYACQNGAIASVVNVLLSTYPESINVKNGFGYTPLAEARAVDNPKMEPVIKVLEKFKFEQDKIKDDSDENSAVEAKLASMTQRVLVLESSLASIANLGKDLKANMKKTKDPLALLSRFADKLGTLDMGIDSLTIPGFSIVHRK